MILGVGAVLALDASIPALGAQQAVSGELNRAQSLYFDARFQQSVDLLLDLQKRVGSNPQFANERVRIALYLGLGYLGLNQTEQAKAQFVQVCTLDRQYTLNPKEFSPKVISLFDEAKAVCVQNMCGNTCAQLDTLISSGNLPAAQALIASNPDCSCSATGKTKLITARFQKGRELYDQGKFADAAREFAAVLALDKTHDLANEYSKLAQQRIDLSMQQAFSNWKVNFDTRQYDKAAALYDTIKAPDAGPVAAKLATQIEAEYQRALSELVTSWKAACATSDTVKMDELRREASTVAPRPALNAKILAEMAKCIQKACMRSDPGLAINRLRSRVNPYIDPSLQRYVTRGIRVAIEIGVDGAVEVKQILNANARIAEALRTAVEQWKFYPAIVGNEPRCVDTELPINLIQQ
jgi:hypothetical protein